MGIVRVTSASPFSGRVHGVKDQRVGVFKNTAFILAKLKSRVGMGAEGE
jgi:hypothetical protein